MDAKPRLQPAPGLVVRGLSNTGATMPRGIYGRPDVLDLDNDTIVQKVMAELEPPHPPVPSGETARLVRELTALYRAAEGRDDPAVDKHCEWLRRQDRADVIALANERMRRRTGENQAKCASPRAMAVRTTSRRVVRKAVGR